MTEHSDKITRRQFLGRASKITSAGALGIAAANALTNNPMVFARSSGQRIKIGQVGTTHAHARGKIETLKKLTNTFELVGVVEPDRQKRRAAQNNKAYKGVTWLTEEQLLNTKGLKAVAVENTEFENVPTALRYINAGIHVHLDKPPGESFSAFKNLLDTAEKRNLTVQLGYMFRNNPAFKFCFDALRKGWLGDVFEVHGVISKKISDERRVREQRYRGGTMFILGCHLIDALVTVLGEPQKVTPYLRNTRPEHDSFIDNTLAVFEYPKATATIRSTMVEPNGSKRRQFIVCGSSGTVEIRPLDSPKKLLLALEQPHGKFKKGYQDVPMPKMPGRYDDQLIEFAQIVKGRMQSPYSTRHDLAAHKALLMACNIPID